MPNCLISFANLESPARCTIGSNHTYVHDRKQRVTVLGATSEQLSVTSGVPQGSLLGPMLFLLFLIPLSFWHEYLDIVFFYKAVNNLIYVNSNALPVARQPIRITRYSSNSSVTNIPKKCRTLSYQRSFFVRWNLERFA